MKTTDELVAIYLKWKNNDFKLSAKTFAPKMGRWKIVNEMYVKEAFLAGYEAALNYAVIKEKHENT
jgi:hypothetical protein